MKSNAATKAQKEMDLLLTEHGDELTIKEFIPEILALVEKFGNSGQSGGSAPYVSHAITRTLTKLMAHQALSPLTGADDEWGYVGDFGCDPTYQNLRDSRVFRHSDGRYTFNDAITWEDAATGDRFTGCVGGYSSHAKIRAFPFTPKTFVLKVTRIPTEDPDDWQYEEPSEDTLREVREYYDIEKR